MIIFAAITPHPPIIIPTIGRPGDLKKVGKTIQAMEKLSRDFAEILPETLIVISPHGPVNYQEITVNSAPVLVGNFYSFGDLDTELIFKNDEKLVAVLEEKCKKNKIPLESRNFPNLDHGSLVPLYYLFKNLAPKFTKIHHFKDGHLIKVVPIIPSLADNKTLFQFGKFLQSIIKTEKSKIALVASGDLSHRLNLEAPAGFSPRGKEFDEKIIKLLKKKDVKGILEMPPDLIEEAGECGYRSIAILLGVLDGLDWQAEILSYEGPFGVGYLVTNFKLKGTRSR